MAKNSKKSEEVFAEKLLDRLFDCRKIEIEHVWHRSAFLGTFIVLAFTGYGLLVGKMLDKTSKQESSQITRCELLAGNILDNTGKQEASQSMGYKIFSKNKLNIINEQEPSLNMEATHLVGMLCGCILLFLGVLWVCIAKGSKRWQEIYERKIILLEDIIFQKKRMQFQSKQYSIPFLFDQFKYKCEYRQKNKNTEAKNKKPSCSNCTLNDIEFCNSNPNLEKDLGKSRSFCSLGAGPYSPSKINILLGWFTCLAGVGVFLFHYGCLVDSNKVIDVFCKQGFVFLLYCIVFIALVVIALFELNPNLSRKNWMLKIGEWFTSQKIPWVFILVLWSFLTIWELGTLVLLCGQFATPKFSSEIVSIIVFVFLIQLLVKHPIQDEAKSNEKLAKKKPDDTQSSNKPPASTTGTT